MSDYKNQEKAAKSSMQGQGERNWITVMPGSEMPFLTLSSFSLIGHKDEAAGFVNWLAKYVQ